MGSACCCCKKEDKPPLHQLEQSETISYIESERPESPTKGEPDKRKTPLIRRRPDNQSIRTKSPPILREKDDFQRFTKHAFSSVDPLKLIDGYLNEPLAPLEEALQPFHDQIDRLSYNIKEAKTKCYYPSQHNLTRDESAAIYIYTMKWGSYCVYDHLQAAWSSENRSQMKPWFKYLKLLKSALNKLPDSNEEVWEGIPYNEKVIENIKSNSLQLYSCLGSCLPDSNQIKLYLQKNPNHKIILIGYTNVKAKLIRDYTASSLNEYILEPGVKLGISLLKDYVLQSNMKPSESAFDEHILQSSMKLGKSNVNGVYDLNTMTIHLVGRQNSPAPIIKKTPIKIKPPKREKHFVCGNTRNKLCSFFI
ncbi:unnamed protein product [Rotaria magnacalcarata]|uniref:Uncharacterized protein n=1 Tax=Rotaria magnacalcarata TaxID=392030 RepID=A0A816ZHJ6_9BILA|nr:unnamed protein product [Rotaria magnacalcarata]